MNQAVSRAKETAFLWKKRIFWHQEPHNQEIRPDVRCRATEKTTLGNLR